MRFPASVITAVVSLIFLEAVFAHNSDARKRHSARLASAPLVGRDSSVALARRGETSLQKRFDNARFSFYDAGLGACGGYNSGSDFIVALNHIQYNSGDYCGKTITITCEDKTTQATIVDECMECPYGALDFSRGLFDFFASESLGYIYGSWIVGSEEPKPSPTPTPKPTPSTTKNIPTPTLTPTSTKTSTTTSSTHHPITTSLSSSSSSASPAITSTSSTTSTPSATPSPTQVLALLDLAIFNYGAVLISGVVGAGGL